MRRLYDFSQFMKIPIKNIWRNRKRSFITILGICIATIALSLFAGYVNIMFIGLKNDAINHTYGHFQIASKGYFDQEENSPTHFINEKDLVLLENKLNQIHEINYFNLRLHVIGIIGNFKKSAFFSGVAGMPEIEGMMTPTIIKGDMLSENDINGILIGKALSEKLGITVGDSVILYVTSETGSQEALIARIRGIYDAVMREQEMVIIYMPIQLGWDLALEKKAHRTLIFLKDEKNMPSVIDQMQSFIDKNKLNMEIRTWEKLAVFVQQVVGMFRGMILVVGAIIFIIIIFSISNTMYMAITERTREIGTMRALGSSRSDIIRIFLAEGFFIGLTGAVIGVVLVSILVPAINNLHITLPASPGQDMPTPVAFNLTAAIIIVIMLVDILSAVWASFLPSLRAARIKVIDAIRER
jgi:putative ABC transport system permease protein